MPQTEETTVVTDIASTQSTPIDLHRNGAGLWP